MSIFTRIFGICKTQLPRDPDCWIYTRGLITVDAGKVPELESKGGAVRLEGKGMPQRVLLLHGEDGQIHAFKNKCTHRGGRRIDPVPGEERLMCCSVGKSVYNYEGRVQSGPAAVPLVTFPVEKSDDKIVIKTAYIPEQ